MELSDVIKVWDRLRLKNPGELTFDDLAGAIKKVVGVTNNTNPNQPKKEADPNDS